jgi:hypothetical protein
VDVHTFPRCVVLHAIAQRAVSSATHRFIAARISCNCVEITRLAKIAQGRPTQLVELVWLVYLVYLVCLVFLVGLVGEKQRAESGMNGGFV